MELMSSHGSDFTVKSPLVFTSDDQAWKACRLVADIVNKLLNNVQETEILRRKVESYKNVFSLWSTSVQESPETRYQDMLYNLSTLLGIERISVLAGNKDQHDYASLYGLSRNGAQMQPFTLPGDGVVIKELRSGKPFVHERGPAGEKLFYYFPILINGVLDGVLGINDRVLTESDIQIISGFCKQTALFIENYRLHQDLMSKFNRVVTISELTKVLAPIQNSEKLLQTILEQSASLLAAEQGSLMLLDQETDALLLEAKKGVINGLDQKIRINRGEGIAGKVAELGEPILVENVENDPRTMQKNRGHYKTRSFVSVPLKIDDRIIGVLNLADKTTGEVFNEDDLKLIQSFATHAAIVVERNMFFNKTEELKKLTITDSLTGLLNRRYLYERLKDELGRAQRHGHHFSLLMLDLDGFKYCNDTLGHLFGDKILKNIADTLINTVRSMDVVARFGGDEFMVILPETDEPLAIDIAERVRTSLAVHVARARSDEGPGPHILTTSIGIVCYPRHGESLEALLENVDKALYRAKNKGKNRTEVYS
ncbi:MAG TPA: sensor domain-containing diguanylate cyclase [Nitrospirota bacterium]|nr:sensor domain-containing diguanylate cyclase [Nitrospirota bacterium]